MRSIKPYLILLLLTSAYILYSCKESKEFNEYANWRARNSQFVDSLAQVADINSLESGLFRVVSFKLDSTKSWGNNSYVYCKILTKGNSDISPLYTDSIRMNYRVRLIPTTNYPMGRVMDQSYKTATLNEEVNLPASFAVAGLIDGMVTALQRMHVGDYWRIYIPYSLGYGTSTTSDIPAYSTLIYDVNLTEVARIGESLSPR